MSDEFDDLDRMADALKATPPTPDAGKKAKNIALAMKNFDRSQENMVEPRPTAETAQNGGFLRGVATMFDRLTSRAAMATTTAIVAVGFTFYVVYPQLSGDGGLTGPTAEFTMEQPEPAPYTALKADGTVPAQEEVADEATGTIAQAPTVTEAEVDHLAPPPMTIVSEARALGRSMPSGQGYASITDQLMPTEPNTETFANASTNPLKITSEEPVSTFSIDVDTASYSVLRSFLMQGQLPPREAVRIEEMINYFPYAYPTPGPDDAHPFRPTITLMDTPWNQGTQLVHIGIQGELPELENRPPLNLVFLIDTSGSMEARNKLPLLKQSFRLMLAQLSPEDQISIVTYAGSAGQVLEPIAASERATILAALERLSAGGGTAGQQGLQQAYAVAESMADEGEVTRIILATDGDFNVGIYDPEALKNFISDKRDSGIYLSVLGFGRGNLDDATMQALAQSGNGTATYIDTLSEAQKVLVDQLSGALFPIADDVKIQVEFNPAKVAEYRLIGYETRALNREDFNNDAVDAGEIGAGHSVTAIYEITPVGSAAIMSDALRYQAPVEGNDSGELGFLKLRYKLPGADTSSLIKLPITPGMNEMTDDTRFAVAIAGFGQLLRGDAKYLGNWGFADAIALASANKGDDAFGYRAEAVTLMRLAQSLKQN